MTRESKLAMMIAVTLILLVGVLLSDHLSGARTDEFDEPAQRYPVAGPLANLPGASEPIALPIAPPPLVTQAEHRQAGAGIIIPQDSLPVEINQGFQVVANTAGIVGRALEGFEGAIATTNWFESPPMVAKGSQSQPPPSQPTSPGIRDLFVPAPPETVTIGGSPVRIGTPVRSMPEPETRPAPRQAAPSFRTHTVQEGDSLYRLAARYLGDGNKWRQLQKLNADQLGESENVQVGMVIKIAPADPAPAARNAPARSQPATTSRPAPLPAPAREYVVLKGDNLGKISLKLLGTSRRMGEIVKLNNLKDPDDIRVGQSLRIPPK